MAELLRLLYEHTEGRREAQSVTDFLYQFVKRGDGLMEDKFLEAVRDAKAEGFREDMNAALKLFSELQGEEE